MVLSPTELVTYGCKFDKEDQVSIFNNQKHIFKNMKYPGLYLPLKTIKTPKWVDVDNEYNILILDAPLENGITPICMSSSNKKSTPKLLAFNGEQSYHDNNSDDPMHPVIDITKLETNSRLTVEIRIKLDPIFSLFLVPSMNALSYKKDGKWYFFGVRYYLGFAWPMSDIFKPVTFGTSTLSKKIHACDNQ